MASAAAPLLSMWTPGTPRFRAELATIDHRRTQRGHGPYQLRRDLRQPMAEKNQAVRFLAPEHQRVAFLAVGIVLGVANQHRIALALRRVFDALQDQREERIRDVRNHDQDFSRPSGAEVLGGGVRRVAEMFDRLEHPESGAGGHDVRAAEYARDRRGGDTGTLRHGVNVGHEPAESYLILAARGSRLAARARGLGSACGPSEARSRRARAKRGCPPPLVAEQAGDQLRRGLAIARMNGSRAEAEGPASA